MILTAADVLAIEREACRRSLATFVREAWDVLEPGTPYVHGWHVEAICEHLEAVTRGEINRLLINIPPGTMKSTLTSVFWPAWEWGPAGMPFRRFIGTSHEGSLATRDARKMRMLVTSEWYQERWPVVLSKDQSEKINFENQARGFRQACPVRSMTGKRGHCLTGDAIILTNYGPLPIREIEEYVEQCSVLSYDRHSGRVVYRPVQAVARRPAKSLVRVHTAGGVTIDCTPDHRIYTARGYVEAGLLSVGDDLLQILPDTEGSEGLRDQEGDEAGRDRSVLRSELQPSMAERARREDRPELQCVRGEDSQGQAAVLGRLPSSGCGSDSRGDEVQAAGSTLRAVRQDLQGAGDDARYQILQPVVRQSGSIYRSEGGEQSYVARRGELETLQAAGPPSISQGATPDHQQGWERVRLLRLDKSPARSPHGYGHGEQHVVEPGDDVSRLPYDMAQPAAFGTRRSAVTLVERVPESAMVYDIQVEGTHCFFANGILVHNCIIWDDPHSAEGANSPAEREEAVRIFRETLPTRLVEPKTSAIVIVMQRLHELDVSGEILAGDYGYEHLMLPMEFEPERRCTTSIGWSDPRTDEGELLFPDRFPAEVVERDKKAMGEYAVAGQNQQRPAPRTGGFFDWEKLEIVQAAPRITEWVRYWDKAGTEGGGKRTAGVRMGRGVDGLFYVTDCVAGQWGATNREAVIRQTAQVDGQSVRVWIEQEPGSGGKESAESTIANLAGFSVYAERPTGDKELRAEPYAVQVAAGNVRLVAGEWNQLFIDEHKTFPRGKFKDQIDAASGAFNKLAAPSSVGVLVPSRYR
jgi:predicted phage terminase large subunit-like protein